MSNKCISNSEFGREDAEMGWIGKPGETQEVTMCLKLIIQTAQGS